MPIVADVADERQLLDPTGPNGRGPYFARLAGAMVLGVLAMAMLLLGHATTGHGHAGHHERPVATVDAADHGAPGHEPDAQLAHGGHRTPEHAECGHPLPYRLDGPQGVPAAPGGTRWSPWDAADSVDATSAPRTAAEPRPPDGVRVLRVIRV